MNVNFRVAAVETRGVCFSYAADDVVHDVSVRVDFGEVVAVAGPNGSAKSTLVEIMAGVRPPRLGGVPTAVGAETCDVLYRMTLLKGLS